MSTAPANETVAIAERLFSGAIVESVGKRPWLVSATVGNDRFSVRQLDPGLLATRVELIHEFLSQPDLQCSTALVHHTGAAASAFDARRWAPGNPLGSAIPFAPWQSLHLPSDLDTSALAMTAESLGAFHSTGTSTSLVARVPQFRAKDALAAVRRSLELNERALAGEIRKESRARRWLTAARPLLTSAETNLELASYLRDEPLVVAHLDLWGSHIVSAAGGSAAFLDCATIGAAPAVVDLAQLIARNGAWSDERIEHMLNGYTTATTLPPLQRRILPWLVVLDAVGSCGHLLARAHDERRPLSDNDRRAVFAGADQQLDLLQNLVTAFVPPPPRQYRRQSKRPTR